MFRCKNYYTETTSPYASTVATGYQTTQPLGSSLPTAIDAAVAASARWLQLYPTEILLAANLAAIINASPIW